MAADGVRRVAIPEGAERPFRVFVNAEERHEGVDFTVEDRVLCFRAPLRPQPPLGLGRKVMLAIGIGVYGDLRGDTLDLQYVVDGGEPRVASLPISPAAAGPPPRG